MNRYCHKVRYKVRFSGDVQGVGFRANAIAQARGLVMDGFIRNEPDGSVLLDVTGSKIDLQELLKRIEASMQSYISDTKIEEHPAQNCEQGFRIQY